MSILHSDIFSLIFWFASIAESFRLLPFLENVSFAIVAAIKPPVLPSLPTYLFKPSKPSKTPKMFSPLMWASSLLEPSSTTKSVFINYPAFHVRDPPRSHFFRHGDAQERKPAFNRV